MFYLLIFIFPAPGNQLHLACLYISYIIINPSTSIGIILIYDRLCQRPSTAVVKIIYEYSWLVNMSNRILWPKHAVSLFWVKFRKIISSYHRIIVSSYHRIIVSSCHRIILSSYHRIIVSSYHRIIVSSSSSYPHPHPNHHPHPSWINFSLEALF